MNESKKEILHKIIDKEHGLKYYRNINTSGYTIYLEKSFITFHFKEIHSKQICEIDYVFITKKDHLVQLLSYCLEFWNGNDVEFIYYREHKRQQDYVKKYFKKLGFRIEEGDTYTWKHPWTSTNGYKESEILEAYV